MFLTKKTNTLTSFFTQGNKRTLRAKRNITVSFISKAISIMISFIIVPLTLGYVGRVEYGIWMTISSIIAWFSFFDIGLGNGLRNKLAEALAKEDTEIAKVYISSSYALIVGIAFLMFSGFYVASNFISWNAALNTDIVSNAELFKIVVVVFFFFCLGFVLKLLSSILQALQKYALNDVIGAINFQAPDESTGTDAILVAAGIEAVAEGDFSSSNNATKLSFKTGASEAAAEKMSLSSAGLLTIADDIVFKDGGTIGVTSATDAMTVSSGGIVTFKDDILIKDGGTIGSASDLGLRRFIRLKHHIG